MCAKAAVPNTAAANSAMTKQMMEFIAIHAVLEKDSSTAHKFAPPAAEIAKNAWLITTTRNNTA
jgi:hypothetical protein